MKVTPVASPTAIQQAPDQSASLKARAVAAFEKASAPAPQPAPNNHSAQLDQNAIAPEDVSAIKAPTQEATPVSTEPVTDGHKDPNEAPKQPEDPALSRQFAQLARQERALRAKAQQQEQAIKAREQALAAKEQELASKQPDLSKYIPRDQVRAEVLDLIARGEVSYDEITQQMLNPAQRDPRMESQLQKMQAKIQELEAKNEEVRKSYADNQTQAYQAAVKQIETDVRALVASDPAFETIKATRSVKDVVELITQTYDKDGILLSVEDAAQQVEDYLIEEAMKLTRISKIQKQLQQSQKVAPNAAVHKQTPQQTSSPAQTQPMKTLTNAAASSRKLSARERALLAFKGELK